MNINKNQLMKLIWIIPALTAFIIALIPTLKYQWPLSWDIIYHIQYAMIYTKYGFTLTDPLLNAPFGQKIGYPPLFHFLIASLGLLTKVDLFQVARALQPFLAMLIVLSVTYVARKLYGTVAGISTGFLILSSFLLSRIILPIPENLALIFLPLSVYFYYRSLKDNKLKYAFISGLIFISILLTHQAAALSLFMVITSFTMVELIYYRDAPVFINYGAFLLLLGSLMIIGIIALLLWWPDIIYNVLNQGISAATGLMTSISSNRPLSILGYLGYLGYLVLIFALAGTVAAFKKRQKEDLLIITWIIIMFLLSNAYWFGINVISYRVLIYLLIPLSIIGGFGVSQIYQKLKDYKRFSSHKFRITFLLSVFILATFSGILTVENPKIATFEVKNQYGTIQIAPPSPSEVDLARWFNEKGDKSKSILTNNLFTGTFLATTTGMPLHYGFEDFNKNIPESAFKQGGIGYIVLDKRLTLHFTNETLFLQKSDSEFYPLVYSSKDISSNITEILPSFIKVVYENQDYIICKIGDF
ncbi:MAG: Oligosaccharyl transferase STT3 subunit [Methanobacterium sp. PtaU1.Bin242]|nr:MAG: Oligosaccharyl transferase STT3 subunit [Methanobacterium sp. PtaU1.Bin242]